MPAEVLDTLIKMLRHASFLLQQDPIADITTFMVLVGTWSDGTAVPSSDGTAAPSSGSAAVHSHSM
jgi:hypothetical protein